jgi:hypothetical protein
MLSRPRRPLYIELVFSLNIAEILYDGRQIINQSINLMIGLLNRPRFIMFVIISRTLTMPAYHFFALQGLGYAVQTKNPP